MKGQLNILHQISRRCLHSPLLYSGARRSLFSRGNDAKTTRRFFFHPGELLCQNGVGGCLLFVPPDPNFVGWSTMFVPPKLPIVPSRPEIPLFAGVDYAGLANAYAPGDEPQMSGMVTERILNDGRAEVTVMLHTKNANAWVIDLDLSGDVLDQIANKPTLFGHRPIDVVNGAPQALGDSLLHVRFINPAPGAPLPDLVQLVNFGVPGIELTFLAFNMSATGPLTEEYGVPEDIGKMHDCAEGIDPEGRTKQGAYRRIPGGNHQPVSDREIVRTIVAPDPTIVRVDTL